MISQLAQKEYPFGPNFEGIGPLGFEGGDAGQAFGVFNNVISSAIGLMTIIAFIWFTFLFISGAYGIMSSGGDKASLENARKRITNGIIGIVVIIAAIFIVKLIGFLLGVDIILNPGDYFESITF